MAIWNLEISKQRYGKIITEIGERYQPLQTEFEFIPKVFDFVAYFDDLDGDKVQIKFEKASRKVYNVGYSYSDNNTKKHKTVPLSHLMKIIYTVIAAVNQFLKEKDPDRLEVFGDDKVPTDKRDFDGQKNRMYFTILTHNIDDTKYKMSLATDKLYIEKRDHDAEDKVNEKLQEWFDYLVGRGLIIK